MPPQAIPVFNFIDDTQAPELAAFAVNMDSRQLYMSFTEPARTTTAYIPTKIVLSNLNENYTLSGGSFAQTGALTAVLTMIEADVNSVKSIIGLFDSKSSSFLRVRSGFIRDMSGNINSDIGFVEALRYDGDVTSPVLLNYRLDLNSGTLLLNFNEAMNVSSLTVNDNLFIANSTGPNSTHISLSGATTDSDFGLQVVLQLTFEDMSRLKQRENLAVSPETTFLYFHSSLITDTSGNPVSEIESNTAQQTAHFIDDSTRPVLVEYSLDMATEPGIISFTFDEIVDASSLNASRIMLQRSATVNRSAGFSWHRLSNGELRNVTLYDTQTVSMQLTEHDYETLKLKHIGDNATTTFLSTETGYVMDMAERHAAAIVNGVDARPVDTIIVDTTRPRVQYFDVNMNAGQLSFALSEPVDPDTFNPEGIQVQNMRAIR